MRRLARLRHRVGRVVLAAVMAGCGVQAHAGSPLTDDLGHAVVLDLPARRIVSLAPHITELLYAAGAGGQLVAAVEYSDYPDAARRLPRIGDAARIDLERLAALQPDLVIAWGSGTPASELAGVRRLGVALYLSEPRRLDAIGDQLRRFGHLAGTEAVAQATADAYEGRLRELRRRYSDRPHQRVFYQLAFQPLLTVNGTHIINDLLTLCGGENVFAELRALTPRLDPEAVLGARPAAVVSALYPGETAADREAFWRSLGLTATRYVAVSGDLIHRPTPRILDGLVQVCEGLSADGED